MALAVLVLTSPGRAAAPAVSTEVDAGQVDKVPKPSLELVGQVTGFLKFFVDPDKTAEEQIALFADDAEYFDRGMASKEAMLNDARRYRRQWPSRQYRIARIDLIFPDPSPNSNLLYVRFEVDFRVANSRRWVAGRGLYGAVIVDIATAPRIVSITESVLSRRKGLVPEE